MWNDEQAREHADEARKRCNKSIADTRLARAEVWSMIERSRRTLALSAYPY